MKLSRRRDDPSASVDTVTDPAAAPGGAGSSGKGRPTPKRRDVVGQRGPVTAPKTRKEAYARQKQLAREARAAQRTPATQLTVAQRRALLKAGDPSVLPRRDQGQTRKLARDYVDSRRMASNYLLVLFLLFVIGGALIPVVELLALLLFVGLLIEWFITGRRVEQLAVARFGRSDGGRLASLSWYCGSRAYLPRRWRLPAPQVALGDEI